MAIKSGFFNSLTGDRKYDANDFSRLFDGIIADGVFPNVGGSLAVSADTPAASMGVNVASGRAYFMGHWIWNDDVLALLIDEAHPTLSRIDLVIVDVDQRDSVRDCTISILKGTAAVSPVAPTLYSDAERKQIALADITVGPGVTTIQTANIHTQIGTGTCPWVVGAVQNIDIDPQLVQWEAIFTSWFETLSVALEGDVAAQLTADVLALQTAVAALEAPATITSGTAAPSGGSDGDIYLRYV